MMVKSFLQQFDELTKINVIGDKKYDCGLIHFDKHFVRPVCRNVSSFCGNWSKISLRQYAHNKFCASGKTLPATPFTATHSVTIGTISIWLEFFIKVLLKMEFRSCARGRQWCGIFHYHWWTASIKPRLLFSHSGLVSWGLPFLQFTKSQQKCYSADTCDYKYLQISKAMQCYFWKIFYFMEQLLWHGPFSNYLAYIKNTQ